MLCGMVKRLIFVALALLLAVFSGVCRAQAGDAAPNPRLGINLAGPADWNSELPFVDVFRLSRAWISQREGAGWGQGPTLELDERGWVKRLDPDCYAETPLCTLSSGRYPSGRYSVFYEGSGKIGFWGAARVVEEAPGKLIIEVDASKGGMFLRLIETDPENYIRNIRVVMPGFEDAYESEPFHPVFLARWKGFATLRFMDWGETNNSEIATWDDRPRLDDATWTTRGIPLEVMIDLANRLRIDPWFCIPHLADDDYVRRAAELVRDRLDPSLKAYVEYSNEVWNGQFRQQRHAGDRGLELGIGNKHWDAGWHYYARRSVQIFDIWHDVFGEQAEQRVARVLSSQAANVYVAEQIVKFEDAGKKADVLAIAPYFGFNVPATSRDDRPGADVVQEWTVDQVLDRLERESLPESIEWMRRHKELADAWGLRLVCYEAGQHAVGVQGGENNEKLTELLKAANAHPRMGELYERYYDAWAEAGGDVMAVFSSIGGWSKWGSWGLAEHYDTKPAEIGKYRATLEWARSRGQDVTMDPTAAMGP